jgi:peptide/nickel transport system permease protein
MRVLGEKLSAIITYFSIRDISKRLIDHKLAVAGLSLILGLLTIATLAPVIAPHDPIEQHLELRLSRPSLPYPLGNDNLGRCVLSQLIYGARVSLQAGMGVVLATTFVGTLLGLVAGYFGGIVDEVIMRVVDVLLAFPGLVLVLVVTGLLEPGLQNVMFALSIVGWMQYARVVRGVVLSVKAREFVEAGRAIGAKNLYLMFRHILPEAIPHVIVLATLRVGQIILAAAALSFLGLGVQPPTPEWGAMLKNGRAFLRTAPHLTIFPGLAIMLTVLAFNFLGDGLRDALDPRTTRQSWQTGSEF